MAEVTNRIKMSQERYDEIRKELEYLQTVREKEVAEQIREARSYGDLSENSEYDAARDEQAKLYAKINEYRVMLESAEIVERTARGSQIGIGSRVTVLDIEENEEIAYELVGSAEADARNGLLSEQAPLGRAMLGHKVGDVISVEAPIGDIEYKILAIE